jgi:SAM-dependent methyltransferase
VATIELRATRCAICGSSGNATEMYPANFTNAAFTPAVFSARRMPDRVHGRIVRCDTCGLVRSDPMAEPAALVDLYQRSTFDYADETKNLRSTYGRYLRKLEAFGAQKTSLLEIGCGNGFFLEEAMVQGYVDVRGVEPGAEAVAKAEPLLREKIACGLLRPGLFEPDSFQVICMFQVFDHLFDPVSVLSECGRLLRRGGLLLILNHNIDSVSARILGERSPIIDVEHTYLYSPGTLTRLLEAQGFCVRRSGVAWNAYSLRYLFRLLPFPAGLKQAILAALDATRIGRLRFALPLGNFYTIAQKPA